MIQNLDTEPKHIRCSNLGIFEAEPLGQFLPVRFADIFLLLEFLFQSFPLRLGEDGASEHAATRFPAMGRRCSRRRHGRRHCRHRPGKGSAGVVGVVGRMVGASSTARRTGVVAAVRMKPGLRMPGEKGRT